MDSIKPFWESIYSKTDSTVTFNKGKPSWDVIEVFNQHVDKGSVLDLGCGDGRNALYAASLGYNVTAVDISKTGILKLKRIATEKGLYVNASIQDMRLFSSNQAFDVIISHGCLHFISRDDWLNVLNNMKEMTAQNGFNVVVVFTNKVPPSRDMKPFTKGLFDEGELFGHYSDWTIHHKSSHTFEDEHEGGIHHVHAVNRIIAQKTAHQ